MAYFDNASTTYPKPEQVYHEMDRFYRESGANVGRGQYGKAVSAGQMTGDTRAKIQTLLHCPAKQVIFTPSDTIALNMILQGLCQTGIKTVYTSPFEHNAVTRVLHHFEKTGVISVRQLTVGRSLEYDFQKIRCQFDAQKPDLVVVSHASNVIGLVSPVKEIFNLSKNYGAVTVVDMAQSAGIVDLDVGMSCIDFAVIAGHKTLYGPTGVSAFVMNPSINLPPVLFGGTGFDSANQDMPETIPERYEMGSANSQGIAGLHAALSWSEQIGHKTIREIEQNHRNRLLELFSRYDYIRVVGNNPELEYVGIVSILIDGISSDSAGPLLDKLGISVRTGLHCAPSAHQFLGTYPAGTIRFSVGYFTSENDFKELEEALDYLEDNL